MSLPVTALFILGIYIGWLPDSRPMELVIVCAGALTATIVSAVFLKSRGIDL